MWMWAYVLLFQLPEASTHTTPSESLVQETQHRFYLSAHQTESPSKYQVFRSPEPSLF